jgi:hypothetical protein
MVVGLGALGGSLSAAFALTRTNQPVDPSLPEGVAVTASIIAAIFSLAIGSLIIWTGLNMLRLRRWAWITTIVLMTLGVVSGLTGLATGTPAGETILRTLIPAAVLALTVTPSAVAPFRR